MAYSRVNFTFTLLVNSTHAHNFIEMVMYSQNELSSFGLRLSTTQYYFRRGT
jgi:hypothetical protein